MDKTVSNPIGLTREMLGIDQAVVAGRNKQRSIEDVKQYIASELEAEYKRGYRDGIDEEYNRFMTKLNEQEENVSKARYNVLRNCLEDIIKTLDSSPSELIKVLQEETL